MTTYFISDIHLNAGSSKNSKILLDFLRTVGPTANAIYILGDLFAIWFGDDLNLTYANAVATALKTLSNQSIPIYYMHGNRDFLLGDKFFQAAGCKLLPDPCLIKLYGKQVLLTHGDLLCTQDTRYQRFRSFVQNPIIKKLFLSLPTVIRLKIGNFVKSKTTRTSSERYRTQPEIFDVNPETVEEFLNKYKAEYLIHGHTHKPAVHNLTNSTRIVLGDWNETAAKILAFNADGFELQDLHT